MTNVLLRQIKSLDRFRFCLRKSLIMGIKIELFVFPRNHINLYPNFCRNNPISSITIIFLRIFKQFFHYSKKISLPPQIYAHKNGVVRGAQLFNDRFEIQTTDSTKKQHGKSTMYYLKFMF
jgi:hypothetical protein